MMQDKNHNIITMIGLALSLAIVLFLFEWKSEDSVPACDFSEAMLDTVKIDMFEKLETSTTAVILASKPPKQVLKKMSISNIEKAKEESIDLEEIEGIVEEVEFDSVEIEEEEELDPWICILGAEEQAMPQRGMKPFFEYLINEINYPAQAKRKGIEGKVILQFIVDAKGDITDIKVLRGIGAGCDEEAIRVLRNSPKWKPCRRRGRAVKQQLVIPISFKLH